MNELHGPAREASLDAGETVPEPLLRDLRLLIIEARERAAVAVNISLTMLYWQIGNRISQELLKGKRADYGRKIVATVSQQLTKEHGKGFREKNLRRMIQFSELFPDREIVVSLIRHLSWTHFLALIPLDDPLKRDFYAEMCRVERWSTRTLRKKIDGMLYERTALSRKPEETIEQELINLREEDRMSPDLVFRDPYVLDFLRLRDSYSEDELESSILRELEAFILELGAGFSFVARQKRMTVDGRDYVLDLLFYHRKLRRLVAVELKMGEFRSEYKGQMELYLRWLEKYDVEPGENPPLSLILCAGKSEGHVELLQLRESGIRVAEYLTELPPRELLEQKLYTAIHQARERLEIKRNNGPLSAFRD